jgi:hypothetical protein
MGSLVLAAMIRFYLWGKTRFFIRKPASLPDKGGAEGD